jgi:hypothetical protein
VSSFLTIPSKLRIRRGRDRADPSITGYFVSPTPGAENASVGAGFGSEVRFSLESGTFTQPFQLTLWTADSNSVIRYFLVTNGTSAAMTGVPDASSPVYMAPLSINESMQVRARAFPAQPGYFPGPLRTEAYVRLGDDIAGFTSDLPVIVFHNMGGGPIAVTDEQFVTMQVFDKLGGRSALSKPPNLAVQGYFHRRGQTTLYQAKANLRGNARRVSRGYGG